MFNIGDYARHQSMGHLGTVFGYGHRIDDGIYLSTLRVKIIPKKKDTNCPIILEDVTSAWVKVDNPSPVSQ